MIDIFGTLGPSCTDEHILSEMFRAGMTGVRLNLSHAMLSDNEDLLNTVKKAAALASVEPKILIDLQGPELRIGDFHSTLQLDEGAELSVQADSGPFNKADTVSDDYKNAYGRRDNPSCESRITVDSRIFEKIEKGDSILLDDGKILAIVSYKDSTLARFIIKRGGNLNGRKSILIEGKTVELPTLTKDDITNIGYAAKLGVTGVMQPFVRNRQDLITLREKLDEAGGKAIEIYAKIENVQGVHMLPELIDECDEIVIARGDLGNAVPLWKLPAIQKQISEECRNRGRRFMVVTQMLSSMEHSKVPTRAEVSDIYNAVMDGASSVMVTGETAIGDFPIEVMKYLSLTAQESEKNRENM